MLEKMLKLSYFVRIISIRFFQGHKPFRDCEAPSHNDKWQICSSNPVIQQSLVLSGFATKAARQSRGGKMYIVCLTTM